MRKRIVPLETDGGPPVRAEQHDGDWLDLASVSRVEITSKDPAYTFEQALLPGGGGWRAAGPGTQTIRLVFDEPRNVRRVYLRFVERREARTPEFVLRCGTRDATPTDILRQQWTFSPSGSTTETEDYRVDFRNLSTLELQLVPDLAGGGARASLTELRLA